MTVSACTTPLNFDMPALTVTIPAETSTCAGVDSDLCRCGDGDARGSNLSGLPLLSTISTVPRPVFHREFLPRQVFQNQLFASIVVVRRDLYSVARAKNSSCSCCRAVHRLGRRIASVPHGADYVRPARVAGFEGNQHFVVGIGYEPAPAIVAGHACCKSRPRFISGAVRIWQPTAG